MIELAGKSVVVMGLGHFGGGSGVARWLVQQGASVLITDLAGEDKLEPAVRELRDLPIRWKLGGHDEADFARADVVIVNPAVDGRNNPYLDAARRAGAMLTSEICLLAQRLPSRRRTIGITGSAGKSTTTAMVGHILGQWLRAMSARPASESARPARVIVGGNLGGSLLTQLHQIHADDWVVLELSSFMLKGLGKDGWSPHVAAVTNLSPNHLDRHGSMDHYRAAKQAILDHQRDEDHDGAVLGPDMASRFEPRVRRRRTVSVEEAFKLVGPRDLLVPGDHNRLNAALAAGIVEMAIGLPGAESVALLGDFAGLPHRLQLACQWQEVRFYNDSKSTTPASALMALRCFQPGRVHVILGGFDKHADMTELARFAAGHCRGVYTLGVTGPTIARLAEGGDATVHDCGTLDAAVAMIVQNLRRGDVVLLSPACASWDQFTHFEQRGERFVELVLRYTSESAATPGPESG